MLEKHILQLMRHDQNYHIITGDSFGTILLQKLGKRRKNDIAQPMRQLARLKIQLNKTSAKDQHLFNYLTPKSFDDCLNAVSAIAGLHQNQ